jgi:hypothetical protein
VRVTPTIADYETIAFGQDYREKALNLNWLFIVIPDLIRNPGFSLIRLDSSLRWNDSKSMTLQP